MFTTYQLQDNIVSWPEDMFSPSIRQTCGYEWSINGVVQGVVMNSSLILDCSLTDNENCSNNILTIHPRVIFENTVLQLVTLNQTTCIRGELPY